MRTDYELNNPCTPQITYGLCAGTVMAIVKTWLLEWLLAALLCCQVVVRLKIGHYMTYHYRGLGLTLISAEQC
jgi:hypothetical protein